MKSAIRLGLFIVLFFVTPMLPISARSNQTACGVVNGKSGHLGPGYGSPNTVELTFAYPFEIGDTLTFNFSGMEVGLVIEIPSGNQVVQYPYDGLGMFFATFTYAIPTDGIQSITITMVGYYVSYYISCLPIHPPVHTDSPSDAMVPTAPDNRLNWRWGDNLAVIYPSVDASGSPAIDIYSVTADSQGVFLCRIGKNDLGGQPASNTLVKHCGSLITVYQLTTGEIQFSIGADAEGKTHVVIVDGIPASKTYSYTLKE